MLFQWSHRYLFMMQPVDISSRFSNNSEAFASEILKNIEENVALVS